LRCGGAVSGSTAVPPSLDSEEATGEFSAAYGVDIEIK
jgi:hypothetical protein